jgi:uncharacterized membrane protein HdeD (DUF308 family)
MKIRLWFVFSAIVLMLALAVLAMTRPALTQPLTIVIPVVGVLALGTSVFAERAVKRRNLRNSPLPRATGNE